MSSLDAVIAEHRRHFEPGTLERFQAHFARSGHLDMLDNAFLRVGPVRAVEFHTDALPLSKLRQISFRNEGSAPWGIGFRLEIDSGATTVETLFRNFVRCTAHTHLIGDFRLHPGYFLKPYSGPRYLLFDGAGTCLLLGAMFQSLVRRLLGETIDLHYSHSANKELTHAFGSWRGEYFVDPDQKTWATLAAIDDSAVFGYLFQQLGVSAHQIYRTLDRATGEFLFASMTRGYFEFYNGSEAQYMYRRHQDIAEVSRYFAEARRRFCSPLSVEASDFPWKVAWRREAAKQGVARPYFLVNCGDEVPIEVPPGGRLDIGLDPALPAETGLLSSLFLGRVPGALGVPLRDGRAQIVVPEFPWLVAFPPESETVSINGRAMAVQDSRCGRYRVVGMGSLEPAFDLSGGHSNYFLNIEASGASTATIVLPFNAFALASGLVRIAASNGAGRTIAGRMAI